MVTGVPDAFYQVCMVLPEVIQNVVNNSETVTVPHDTVFDELKRIADKLNMGSADLSLAMSIYLLGFSSYNGFNRLLDTGYGSTDILRQVYEYTEKYE